MAHLGNKVRRRACFDVEIKNVGLLGIRHEKLLSSKKPPKVFVKFQFAKACTVYFEGKYQADEMKLKPCNPELCSFWYTTVAAHLLKRQELKISVFSPSNAFLSQLDSMLRRGEPFAVSESFGAVFDIGECKPAVDLYILATKTIKHELGLFNHETSCGRVKFELTMTETCPETTCMLDEVQLQNWERPKTQYDADADQDFLKKELKLTYFYAESNKQSEAHETKTTSASAPVPAWMNFDLIKFHGEMPKMAKADIHIALHLVQMGTQTEIGRAKLPLSKYYTGDSDHAVSFEEVVIPAVATHIGTVQERKRKWKLSGCIKFANGPQFAQMTQGVHRETGVVNGFLVGVSKKFSNPDDKSCDHPLPPMKLERQDSVVLRARAKQWRKRNENLKQEVNEKKGICAKYGEDILAMTRQARQDGKLKEKKRKRIRHLKNLVQDLDDRILELMEEVNSKQKPHVAPLPEIHEPEGEQGNFNAETSPQRSLENEPTEQQVPTDVPYLESSHDYKIGVPHLEPVPVVVENSISEENKNIEEPHNSEHISESKHNHDSQPSEPGRMFTEPETSTDQKENEPFDTVDTSTHSHKNPQQQEPSENNVHQQGVSESVSHEQGHSDNISHEQGHSENTSHEQGHSENVSHEREPSENILHRQGSSTKDIKWNWDASPNSSVEMKEENPHEAVEEEEPAVDSREEWYMESEFVDTIMVNCRITDKDVAVDLISKHKDAANIEEAIIDDMFGVFGDSNLDFLTAHLKH